MVNWKFFLPATIIVLVAAIAVLVNISNNSNQSTTPASTATPSTSTNATPTATPSPVASGSTLQADVAAPVAAVDTTVNSALDETLTSIAAPESDPSLVSGTADSQSVSNIDNVLNTISNEL